MEKSRAEKAALRFSSRPQVCVAGKPVAQMLLVEPVSLSSTFAVFLSGAFAPMSGQAP